jgi:hypothetical protein
MNYQNYIRYFQSGAADRDVQSQVQPVQPEVIGDGHGNAGVTPSATHTGQCADEQAQDQSMMTPCKPILPFGIRISMKPMGNKQWKSIGL